MKTTQRRPLTNVLCALLLALPLHTRAADNLVSFNDFWLYFDAGIDQGTAWREVGFWDGEWSLGISEFGFGEGDEFTALNSAPNGPLNTAYFRTYFRVSNAGSYSNLTLRLTRDDGAVVYINGVEVLRNNMPAGDVTYTTKALRNLEGVDETRFTQRVVPATVLVTGQNLIAVETHQADGGDDDMSFAIAVIGHRTGENQPPSANPSFITAEQDKSVAFTLAASDPDSNPLTYTLISAPTHGSLGGSGLNVTYTPEPGYVGPDLFSFQASDGQWTTEVAEVGIEVKPVSNHPPVANGQNLTVNEDRALAIALIATDPDDDALIYAYTQPAHGTLHPGIGHSVIYQPAVNYFGADSFTFTVDDGKGGSANATISITVLSVNDSPVVAARNLTTAEDTALDIVLNASDVDGDALTFSFTQPAHGTVTGIEGGVTYLPATNYNGPDSFTFTSDDGNGGSATATINIEVTPVNDAPVALAREARASDPTSFTRNLALVTPRKRSVLVLFDGSHSSDADGDGLSYAWYRGTETTPFSTDASPTASFGPGTYTITLVVSDGVVSASDSVSLQVFTPRDRIKHLITQVQAEVSKPSERNGLLGQLNASCSNFENGNIAGGVHQLELFQTRVNNKIAPTNPALAHRLNREAQQIIHDLKNR